VPIKSCDALALFAWAMVTITRGGSNIPADLPTTTIVESGPYRFTRNPIYRDDQRHRHRSLDPINVNRL
jgi:hypothetical protein